MIHVYYDAGSLAGLTSSMRCLVPLRGDERQARATDSWPAIAYWRRLAGGVTIELDGQQEEVAIGAFRTGSLYLPSVVDCMDHAPTPELHAQAMLAVESMRRCAGVVLVYRSNMRDSLQFGVEDLRADFARVGRRLEDVPIVLQATFQDELADAANVLPASVLGAAVGIPERLCVPSVANECVGVREALSLLLQEIRAQTPAG
jgi:hypothetical protein